MLDFHNRTILFRVGDWIFVTYGLVTGAAFFIGFSVGLWYDAMTGQDIVRKAQFYSFFLLPAVLVGARAFSVLLEWRLLFRQPLQTLAKPGYMLHGGLFGGMAALVRWGLLTKQSVALLLDAGAFALPLGEAVGRLGCYVYGCCWGKPTTKRIGVKYTNPHAKVFRCAPELRGVKIHPVQIYGLVAHLALFAAFYSLLPYKAFDGMFAALYGITHPGIRFTLERFRRDDRGKLFGPFTHTDLYSTVMIVMGITALVNCWRFATDTPLDREVPWAQVIAEPGILFFLSLVTLVVILAFGVHYRSVGSWVPRRDSGMFRAGNSASGGAGEV